jgi:AraC-like DNA-binding protein
LFAVEPDTGSAAPVPTRPTPLAVARARSGEMVFNGRDEWQTGLQEHLLPLQCFPADPQTFKSNAVITHLCGATLAELRVDASRLVRRDLDVGSAQGGAIQVLWQLAGRSRFHQGPHSATLDAGCWTVCDTGREYTVDFDPSARCLLILLPRSRCAGWLNAVDALAAWALPASGPAHIARTLLATLLREAADLDARSERALHDSVLSLIDQALQLELARRGISAQERRPVSFARVQAYVQDHLGDKALTVERVAAAFGMSRRNLYNVFAPVGVTPHAFIQDAKLDRARALLSDPTSRNAPIGRIAEQCGFADAAHFSRAFHARHGAAPALWRARLA